MMGMARLALGVAVISVVPVIVMVLVRWELRHDSPSNGKIRVCAER
jgi:hypothetical protein